MSKKPEKQKFLRAGRDELYNAITLESLIGVTVVAGVTGAILWFVLEFRSGDLELASILRVLVYSILSISMSHLIFYNNNRDHRFFFAEMPKGRGWYWLFILPTGWPFFIVSWMAMRKYRQECDEQDAEHVKYLYKEDIKISKCKEQKRFPEMLRENFRTTYRPKVRAETDYYAAWQPPEDDPYWQVATADELCDKIWQHPQILDVNVYDMDTAQYWCTVEIRFRGVLRDHGRMYDLGEIMATIDPFKRVSFRLTRFTPLTNGVNQFPGLEHSILRPLLDIEEWARVVWRNGRKDLVLQRMLYTFSHLDGEYIPAEVIENPECFFIEMTPAPPSPHELGID